MRLFRWRLYRSLLGLLIILLIVSGVVIATNSSFKELFNDYEEIDVATLFDEMNESERKKSGEFITLYDVELGTSIDIDTTAAQVFAVGTNWFPVLTGENDDEFVINRSRSVLENEYTRYIELPVKYPAGEYRFGAIVTTTNKNDAKCCICFYDGDTAVGEAKISANTGTVTDAYIKADAAFDKIAIYSGGDKSGSSGHKAVLRNVCLRYGNRSAKEYEQYCGGLYDISQGKITALSRPLYLFAADGAELEIQYAKGTIELDNYYFSGDYLPNKTDTINTLMKKAGEGSDAFIFITDLHLEKNSNAGKYLSLIEYINKYTEVNKLFVGGDMYSGGTKEAKNQAAAQLQSAFKSGDIHYVMGNHEYDAGFTDSELYDIYNSGKTEQIGNNGRNYYYVDNKQQKIRYIVLNPYNLAEDLSGTVTGWDSEQKAWLDNEALNVESGWGIIIYVHHFWANDWKDELQDSIDGYSGKGEILAVFHGHLHADSIKYTAGGTPCIGVACDKYNSENDTLMKTQRTVGTVTEQAFDVVIVDRTAKKIHCVRIGAPALDGNGDADNDQVEIRTVNYK